MQDAPDDRLPPGTVLGRLADCPDGRVAKLAVIDGTARIIAVRRGDRLRAYRNVCPHMGKPLDDLRDAILSVDGQRLVCSAHNAAFAVDTGHAVRGLPSDCGLTPVVLSVTSAGTIITT